MNILFLSHLTNEISQGPNYSVPARIFAQSKYDNVFWWNLTDAKQDFWVKTGLFHNITDYSEKTFSILPSPFNKPDIVVFESLYYYDDIVFSKNCKKNNIPYVIVPRSALTYQGQSKKKLKKRVANFIFFNSVIKNASGIQYLTQKELEDSGNKWNEFSFVIPNGIEKKQKKVELTSPKNELQGIYIGRFDPFQKGLDLLLNACLSVKDELLENNVVISLHGPERLGCRKEYIEKINNLHLNKILKVKEGVFGTEKEKVLLDSDFFIMTSRFEGMPMSMIEALSYGLPCFATEGTNMTDDIRRYSAGWTCDNTSESISKELCRMIAEKDKIITYSKNAISLSEEYNWDRIAQKTHDQFVSIVS